MKNFIELLRKFSYFFNIYSFVGAILLGILVYFFITTVNNIIQINNLLKQGNSGINIEDKDYSDIPSLLFIILLILGSLYFILLTPLVIFLRNNLKRTARNFSITQEGNDIDIILNNYPLKFLFFVEVKAYVTNITHNHKKVDYVIKNNIVGNSFKLKINSLPTSKYRVKHLIFSLKDPLYIFDTQLFRRAYDFEFIKRGKYLNNTDVISMLYRQVESNDSFLSNQPTEGYFGSRPYYAGDEVKRINWKNTAKLNSLSIKTPEESPFEYQDLNIVLNLYHPFINRYNMFKSIGEFLDAAFAVIYSACFTGQNVNLYINSHEEIEITSLQDYDKEEIDKIILSKVSFQSGKDLDYYVAEKQIQSPHIVTLSSSHYTYTNLNTLYLYNQLNDYNYDIKTLLKLFYTNNVQKSEDKVTRYDNVLKYNLINLIIKFFILSKLQNLLKKNIDLYQNDNRNIQYI